MRRRHRYAVIAAILLIAAGSFVAFGRVLWYSLLLRVTGPRTVADAVAKYGPAARGRLAPHFRRAGVAYPPKEIVIDEGQLPNAFDHRMARRDGRTRLGGDIFIHGKAEERRRPRRL